MSAQRNPVVQIHRNFTTAEDLVNELRVKIFESGKTYAELATAAGCSKATINRLASGNTKWPRPNTLFGVLAAIGANIRIE